MTPRELKTIEDYGALPVAMHVSTWASYWSVLLGRPVSEVEVAATIQQLNARHTHAGQTISEIARRIDQ